MPTGTESRYAAVKSVILGEGGRRIVHASGSVLPALYLLDLATWQQVQALFVVAAVATGVLEFFRLRVGLDWFVYEHLTREYEQDSIAGYMLYMVSSTAVVLVAAPEIAIPAVLMLMLGDPISGTVSDNQLRVVKRPRELAAMFVVCALIALPFHHTAPLAVVLGGVGGMLADGVKPIIGDYVVDDNLTIPPLAALGLWLGVELSGLLF